MKRVTGIGGIFFQSPDPGCNVLDKTEDSEYGKFGWAKDPDGNKVELWQPPVGR